MAASRDEVISLLIDAYCMELDTVLNFLANSTNLDGVRAEEIKKSLAEDVLEEIGHAQLLAKRIKQLEGFVPGSASVKLGAQIQPPEDTTDVVSVIKGVMAAETHAIAHYRKIIQATDGDDYITQDLCIRLMSDEEEHLALFRGFLKEYEKD